MSIVGQHRIREPFVDALITPIRTGGFIVESNLGRTRHPSASDPRHAFDRHRLAMSIRKTSGSFARSLDYDGS